MEKHTPGPWTVIRNENDHWGMRRVDGPKMSVVGFTIATDVSQEQAETIEADARLIAAAPQTKIERDELLEACKMFMDCLDSGVLVRNIENDAEPGFAVEMMEFVMGLNKAQAAIENAERIISGKA